MSILEEIAKAMPPLSHLECHTCGRRQEVGVLANNFAKGWPTCCNGHTMHLITAEQAAAVGVQEEQP